MTWNQEKAVVLCRAIEALAPDHGCHVALTGGTLYKDGERKDVDILFYRIRQVPSIDMQGLLKALIAIGIDIGSSYGWVLKAKYEGKSIDFFFPECEEGEYPVDDEVEVF